MANKTIVETECDQCGTKVHNDMPADIKDTLRIPMDWIQIRVDTRQSTLFTKDLCPTCKLGILNAAGYSPRKMNKVVKPKNGPVVTLNKAEGVTE